jgi:preprotein translocase subunit SecG
MTRPETNDPVRPVALYEDIPDTGKHLLAHLVEVHNAGDNGASSPDPVERLIQGFEAVVETKLGGGGGGGGGGGDDGCGPGATKSINKTLTRNTIMAIVTILAGVIGAYYATEARSKDNEAAVKDNKKVIETHTDDIRDIKVEVKDVGSKVDDVSMEQKVILDGIEQLKEEAKTEKQKRLEEKVRELERENRRLERRNR